MKIPVLHKESTNWKIEALKAAELAKSSELKAIMEGLPDHEDERMPAPPPVDEGMPDITEHKKINVPLATLADAFDVVIKGQKK